MFNSSLKKENIERLENSVKVYDGVISTTKDNSMKLLDIRLKAVKLIGIIERYINTIANTPKTFEKEFADINFIVNSFNNELNKLGEESGKVEKVSGSVAGAGVAAGIGVTAFAPTAAMAIATTFGTASTGAAIASLSGAAATNAALAWLGGGALVAGGGGMAAGNALLALAGPVGWAIGGGALIGSGIFASSKNKKIAEEAYKKALEVEEMTRKFKRTNTEIQEIHSLTVEHGKGINKIYEKLKKTSKTDFNLFNDDEKFELGSLVNNTKSFAKLLNRVVS
ncbi:hypothetical protein [Clostridium beijerinckii]|uniref:Uncharacterized protein n=1 Tax=Clostridium beijerinckii TaxID=1520 RepID=A0A1S8S472_CLOBE|nr:hypothetical protein [Clostridium beijerinckii]NRY59520.1 hypothetical protein [Clostridium beijerinckii]OOM60276.1 hypothetical protein CLBCK_29750 [Clostridium beijerinckii]